MDNPRPTHLGLVHYRVRADATLHATIRASPHQGGHVLGRLAAGEDWHGTPIVGQMVDGGNVWVRSEDFRFVFLGALEQVQDEA